MKRSRWMALLMTGILSISSIGAPVFAAESVIEEELPDEIMDDSVEMIEDSAEMIEEPDPAESEDSDEAESPDEFMSGGDSDDWIVDEGSEQVESPYPESGEDVEYANEGFPEEEAEVIEEQEEILAFEKASAATSAEGQEAEIKSGSFENLSWTLDEEGTLTIAVEGEYTGTVSLYDLEQKAGFAESDEELVTSLIVTGTVRELYIVRSDTLKSVDVRGTVTYAFRFYECPELETVHVARFAGNTLSDTFKEDSKLVSFVMDEADQAIDLWGSNFFHCTALTEISLPRDIIGIGWSEFSGCASLTELPDLTKIEELRYGRPAVPDGETVADIGLFAGCSSLTEIRFAEDSEFSAMPGFDNTDKDMLGFKGCTSLESVTLPARFATEIPKSMFEGCSNLKEIVNIDNDMIKVVNMNAFAGCSSLKELRLADTVTTIYKGALPDGLEHFQVPKSAERWNEALANCTKLKELRIPGEVTTMYKKAALHNFSCGGDIETLIYEPRVDFSSEILIAGNGFTIGTLFLPEGMEKLEYSLGNVDHLIMPDTIIEAGGMSGCGDVLFSKNLKILSKSAFSGNKRITGLDLPESLESIGDYAFQNCTALSELNLPEGLTSIGTYAFSKCTSLTELTIPGTVEEMGTRCFENTGLMSVVIEEGVTDIPREAFYYARSLTDVSLPESLGRIEYGAFRYTTLSSVALNQKEIVVEGSAFLDVGQMSLENESLTLENYAISGCNHILFNSDRVVFQEGTRSNTCISLSSGEADITFLKGSVDLGENGIELRNNNLKIFFGPSVTEISGSLTVNSTSSVEIHAPAGSVGQAFAEENGLKFVDSDGEDVNWMDLASGYQYLIEDDHIVITGYIGKEKDPWIPETLFGYPVTEIRDIKGPNGSPRKGKSGITGIDFPASITKIDPDFTLWSSALKTVSVSGTNEHYKALAGALYNIDTTTLIKVMPAVTSIKIPDTVTEIGERAFSGNSKISSVTFGENPGLQSIGEKAFYNCVWLEEMDLPQSLESIGDGAFAKCKAYNIEKIPVGVKTIGDEAFWGCNKIRSVDLPDTVETLGRSAFPYEQIEYMTFAGPVQIADDEFETISGMLYVPEKGELYTILEKTNRGRVRTGLLFEHYVVGLEVYEENISPYVPIKSGRFIDRYGVRFTRAIQPESITLSIKTMDDEVLVSSTMEKNPEKPFEEVVTFNNIETGAHGLPADTEVKMTVFITYKDRILLRLSDWDSKDIWTRTTLPDMWGTSNRKERIPDYIYDDYFTRGTAKLLRKKHPDGSNGICFGMALALQLFRSGDLNITDFNADTLWEAKPENNSSKWQMSIKELWQSLQLFQYTNDIGRMGQNNWGDYAGLYTALQNMDKDSGTKLVVCIKKDIGDGSEVDHEVAPLKVLQDTGETIHVLCYDPNGTGDNAILSVSRYTNFWYLNSPAGNNLRNGNTISYVIVRDEWKDFFSNWKCDKTFKMDPERMLVYSFNKDYEGNSMPQAGLLDREVSPDGTSLFYHDRADGPLSMHLNMPESLLMMSTDDILMTASFTSGTGMVSMLPAGGEDTSSVAEITPDETGRYEVTIEYDDSLKVEGAENGRSFPDMLTLTGETKETVKLEDTPKGVELTGVDTITMQWINDGKITEKTWTGLDNSSQGSDNGRSHTLIEVDEQNGEVVMAARIDTDGDGTYEKELLPNGMKKSADDLDITLSKTSFVYTGKVQRPSVTVKDGSKTVAESEYDIVWPAGCINAGSYKVVINLKGNYTGTAKKTFTITKAGNAVTSSDITRPFSAKAQTFSINARATGGKLTYKSDNAKMKVSDNGKVTIAAGTAGTAKITITAGDSNYQNATKTILVTVPKGANAITASDITRSYSINAQTVLIDSKATGGKLTYSSNDAKVNVDAAGKVTIDKKFSGTARITITAGDSNYQTVTKTINITVPKTVKLSSVKNTAAKKIKVKWKKGSEITGYQIQYSLKSNFKGAKKATIKNEKTVSKVIKGLKKGKKYYVRIRTYKMVGGEKYFSAWSAKKKVTIKK